MGNVSGLRSVGSAALAAVVDARGWADVEDCGGMGVFADLADADDRGRSGPKGSSRACVEGVGPGRGDVDGRYVWPYSYSYEDGSIGSASVSASMLGLRISVEDPRVFTLPITIVLRFRSAVNRCSDVWKFCNPASSFATRSSRSLDMSVPAPDKGRTSPELGEGRCPPGGTGGLLLNVAAAPGAGASWYASPLCGVCVFSSPSPYSSGLLR